MGAHRLSNMKFFAALFALVAIHAASAEPTYEDCVNVVSTIAAALTSEESVATQVEVLLAGLPDFWAQVAAVLWPGYFDPTAAWMCGNGKQLREFTCDECKSGMMGAIDQLLSEEFVNGIVDALSGEGFCGQGENPEECANVISVLIPAALPILAGNLDEGRMEDICNAAQPGAC